MMNKVSFSSVTEVLFLITWVSVVIWYIQYLWKRKKLYTYCKEIKGPFALPLVGSSYCFLQGSLGDIFGTLMGLFKKYPGIAKFWHGQELMFLISDPEIAQVALTSPKGFAKSSLYRLLEDGLGHGLFTAPTAKWKQSRKHLNPVFSKQMLNNFQSVYIDYGEKLNRSIAKVLKHGEMLDVYKIVKRHVLNILCETIMGIELTGQSEDDFGHHIDQGRNICFFRIMNVLYHSDFLFKLSKDYRDLQESLAFVQNFVRNVIIEQQMCVLKNNRRNALFDAQIEEGAKKATFLQRVLESPVEWYNTQDIQNEVYTFLSGGSDTTTNSICFVLTLLAMHPEIQAKVYNEVIDILGTEREMQPEDLDKFEYLERVLKETLRLFPAGPMVGRTLEADLELKDGTTLPQGCTLIVGIFTIHRNEKYWKNPLKFDPDRFLPENFVKQHPCTFMPFSYGPRNCIANKFAMGSMKVLVANMVRRFHFKTNYRTIEDIETFCGVILQPKKGFDVQLVARTVE